MKKSRYLRQKTLQSIRKYGQYHRPIARPILFWLNGDSRISSRGISKIGSDATWVNSSARPEPDAVTCQEKGSFGFTKETATSV